jgi:POT family proton-dependent oligopeptide transporter
VSDEHKDEHQREEEILHQEETAENPWSAYGESLGGDGGEGPEPPPGAKQPKGQPAGLWVLFLTEMWERFSYYGMRALLVLYLIAKTTGENPGFGWEEENANLLYGFYTCMVYLTPILGGWLADKFLGTNRSMLIGGWIIAVGHFCLAATELFGHPEVGGVYLDTSPGQLVTFMLGLFLIVVGTGFFKPCVSVMVGQLYSADDPRRDSGFTIFYMGINVGAFLSGIVAGTLGEKIGWHWGFGSAGVGMIFGLVTYQILRPKFLQGVGLPPGLKQEESQMTPLQLQQAEVDRYEQNRPLTRVDWERMAVVLILTFFSIVFWVAFEQAGTSLNIFAKQETDRSIPFLPPLKAQGELDEYEQQQRDDCFIFPATWYQSANPASIVLFAPLVAWLWIWLQRRRKHPSIPVKFGLGFLLLSLGYVAMIFGAVEAKEGLAGPHWLLICYVMMTLGELCISPVGLSMVTKLSPARYTSGMMGLYFGMLGLANLLAGVVASMATRVEKGDFGTLFGGLPDFFLFLAVLPIIVGLIVLALAGPLKKMMHGLH